MYTVSIGMAVSFLAGVFIGATELSVLTKSTVVSSIIRFLGGMAVVLVTLPLVNQGAWVFIASIFLVIIGITIPTLARVVRNRVRL